VQREQVQRELVERAQHGDRASFGVLAEASVGRLFTIAQLMLADNDLAEDAVQEALILAWRGLRGLRDPERFHWWIQRILLRSVYRVAKTERRQVDPRRYTDASDAIAQDAAAALADRDEIDRGFRRLKPDQRAVLVLHHYLGLSDQEAGEVLGIPAGTVKSRLHRATAAMRAELDAGTRQTLNAKARSIR
jgi:RNA polymerase sigma-70 factor, ECF subfamily